MVPVLLLRQYTHYDEKTQEITKVFVCLFLQLKVNNEGNKCHEMAKPLLPILES